MQMTVRLWGRTNKSWLPDSLEKSMSALGSVPMNALPRWTRKKGRATPQGMQAKAYVARKERC
eukprot:7529696-Karenia_brevis.AAC.1